MGTKKKSVGSKKSGGSTSVPLVRLTPDEMRRMAKPHTGYELFVPELVALYDAKKAQLGISGISGADISQALERFNSLRDQEIAAVEQLALIQGSRFYYSSTAYSLVLEVYARFQVAARTDPAIALAISKFTEFMKHIAPRKSDAAPVTSTTSTTNGTEGSSTPTGGSTS